MAKPLEKLTQGVLCTGLVLTEVAVSLVAYSSREKYGTGILLSKH